MPTIKIVYVPQPFAVPKPSSALSANEAKSAVIDYILKRLILKPTE
ncbi:hypothetical protein [Paenibacillus naphthalenovorans]|jgi:hypothetical protein|nr:hypothetical protein [Paenibacillus naphthalenovorans]SDJ91067.1 hypothetical protein SAMN05421868_1565 [Paenibacillus naphthalenovorans]